MRKIIKKTEKELIIEAESVEIKVKDTRMFYWSCEKCLVAYFDEDIILHRKTEGYFCLNKIPHFFGEKVCNNKIYSGDEASFNKYYKLK